jgi:hypothetical protein
VKINVPPIQVVRALDVQVRQPQAQATEIALGVVIGTEYHDVRRMIDPSELERF